MQQLANIEPIADIDPFIDVERIHNVEPIVIEPIVGVIPIATDAVVRSELIININDSIAKVDMKELGQSVNAIRSAWNEKDYEQAGNQCRTLLEYEPENVYGLIYLSRTAAYTGDWPDVERAGAALARRSPRDAFQAARKLNQSGRVREAARIFSDIDIRPDWFDAKMADLAWKEGISLLKAGHAAMTDNDAESAKVLWIAGVNIAPRSQLLRDRVTELALEAKAIARRQDLAADPDAYVAAWREVLGFNPSDTLAATKIARAYERIDERDAVTAWLKVLAIEPAHELAQERLRRYVGRNDLEGHAIRALVEMGWDENADPLIREFTENRDVKARIGLEKVMKARLREALERARAVDRVQEPRLYLEVWKNVLVLNPLDIKAAKRVVSSAAALADYSELVEGVIAHLEITPGDPALAQRLAGAALRAGQEERALEYLARHNMADFSVRQVESLQKRVIQACKNAMKAYDFDHALSCFHALELADAKHPAVDVLRPVLAKKAASQAKDADRQGNLGVAVPLAQKVLEIAPDQPAALTIVARDLLRHRRFSELVELCGPQVKPWPEYASLQKLLDKAAAKMAP